MKRRLLNLLALFSSVALSAAAPARALELPKTFGCPSLLDDPAWKDYRACFEHPDGDILTCAVVLLMRVPKEKQDIARAALVERVKQMLEEAKIPYRVDPTVENELILDPAILITSFPKLADRLEKAQTRKNPAITEFRFTLDHTENFAGGFYHSSKRSLSVTPAGLAALLKGDPEGFLIVDHELSHAYLSLSNSHLNTVFVTLPDLLTPAGFPPAMALMPASYRNVASLQELYTYSKQLEAIIAAATKGIAKNKVRRADFAGILGWLGSRARVEIPTLKEFIPGAAYEIEMMRKAVASGAAGLMYDPKLQEVSFLTAEGRKVLLLNLPISPSEHKALSFLAAFQPLQTNQTLLKNGLNSIESSTPEFRRLVVSLKTKADLRFCVLELLVAERARTLAEIDSSRLAYLDRLVAGESLSETEMTNYLRRVSALLSRGVKKATLKNYETTCKARK